MKKKIKHIMKTDTVLVVAVMLAAISAFFIPPCAKYFEYIDFRVLGILFALMTVMEGFAGNGVFRKMGELLVGKCGNTRSVSIVLVFICFFSSMLLTNDVALITFVPFTILTLKISGKNSMAVPVIVAQTIAANLGSMLTPMGNPQNLYLYGLSGMNMGSFIMLMLPYTLGAAVLLLLFIFFIIKKEEVSVKSEDIGEEPNKMQVWVYGVLFLLCVLTVIRLIPWEATVLIVLLVAFVMDKNVLLRVDYSLLLTFIGFFVFIGNMGQIETVRNFLESLIRDREVYVAAGVSQIVSNVPAALLLSGFTDNYKDLIIGTNLGGLGTLIASMASLISYKQVAAGYENIKGKYLAYFTVVNIIFLAVLMGLHIMLI